jgi:hypothetical protein
VQRAQQAQRQLPGGRGVQLQQRVIDSCTRRIAEYCSCNVQNLTAGRLPSWHWLYWHTT